MVFDNGFFSEASPSPFERDDICPCKSHSQLCNKIKPVDFFLGTLKSWVKSHACDSRAKFGLERHPSVSSHKAVIPQPCGTSSDASITCLSPSSPDMMDMIMDRAEAPYGKSWSAVVGSPYIQECAKRRAL